MNDAGVHLQAAVLHVGDLGRAIAFYTQLLGLEVARRTPDAVVLATRSGTATLAMRERHVQHVTDRTVQALVWRLPTMEHLDDVEQRAKRLTGRTTRRVLTEDAITVLSAWDPEGQRLVFLHHDGDNDVPRSIPAEVFWY
ncbi:VOC family protein [Jiangella aurantiaca]|uniref:VOC family protein n=1 Tax=Jiangella aurantiaca TaxID=2530373 RepID=A0A4R5AG07_9ACTN|nr:VOC family protein [Jiangella aurantiaca]TDD68942.1 VOC family protein [Jiangella aurantiaca]